jgi:3-oxoacyl-[acyl-carrier-protein] synthase-3
MTTYSKIVGTGSYLPAKRVTNQDWPRSSPSRASRPRTNGSSRAAASRRATTPRRTSSPATWPCRRPARPGSGRHAAQRHRPDHRGHLTPDFLGSFPSTACIVQRKLGITNGAPAIDVQAVCSGFVYACRWRQLHQVGCTRTCW